ncbi:MAG: DNA double-strand break repair nuclease NurA [Candidatus Bathyarchaeia archaeon]
MSHRTQTKRENNSLISGSLRERKTTYPRLCLALRNLILDEVSRDVHEDFLKLPEVVSAVKERLALYPVDRKTAYGRVAGADAGSQRVPLASRWFAVIAALLYQLPNAHRYFTDPETIKLPYSFSGEKFHEIVSVRREAKLFETSAEFVMNHGNVDLILIDGPLAFGNWWTNKGEERDRFALISSINLLLSLCALEDVAVAGVVKRATARYLIHYLGLQQRTSLSDAFVLLQTLRPGERTDVFSPREALKRTVRAAPFMDLIDHPIYSFYMRSSSNYLVPPIRIDIPGFMLDRVDDLASYCYSTAVRNGIPLPVVKADEEVRVTKRFVNEVYSELIPRLESRFGPSLTAGIWGEFK